jgi:hypothetical protein
MESIRSIKEFSGGRRMYKFSFVRFIRTNGLTVEKFAKEIGYSTDGVVKMIIRGTIKKSLFEKLSKKYKGIETYRRTK